MAVRRLPKAAAIVVLLVVLPAVVGGLLAGSVGAAALVIGIVGGLLASLGSGVVAARRHLPVLAGAFAVGGLLTGTWWWVLAASALAAYAGWSARDGLLPLFVLSDLVLVTAKPVDSLASAAIGAVIVVAGGLLGTELARRAGAPADRPADRATESHARIGAVVLGLAVLLASALALGGGERGYWIPMTVLILAQPAAEGRMAHSRQRLLGTMLGFVALLPLALVAPARPVQLGLAILALLLVVAVSEPYWLRSLLVTVTVVLLLAPPGSSTIAFAGGRLAGTLLGVAILVGGAVAATAWAQRVDDRLVLEPEQA